MSRYRKHNSIGQSFIAHPREMRESAAWLHLPNNARRILDRLELEHMRHGGAENGKLPCTYTDFMKAGIRRASIALALRQCQALGFLECTRQGWCSVSGFRTPSLYRLTYVHGWKQSPAPTNAWKLITSDEVALLALAAAKDKRRTETQHGRSTPAENIERRLASAPGTVDALARPIRRSLVTR